MPPGCLPGSRSGWRSASNVLKILILKPSSLGDVIQAIPVLRLLKKRWPQSKIYWWLSADLQPLLEDDPDLSGIVPFERRHWKHPGHWLEQFRAIQRMRAHRFDWVIDLQGLARSGAFAWLANGAFTIGLADPREGAFGFYDVAVPRPSPHTHAVDWYLSVLKHLDTEVTWDFEWLPSRPSGFRFPEDSQRWIAINPGARWLNKRWPVTHFTALLRKLADRFPSHDFAICGAREDFSLGEQLAAAVPNRSRNLCGKTSLSDLIAWLRRSEVVITNDTGPMHIAAALKRPIVALFGPTNPRRTGPYGQLQTALQHPLPCAPCLKARCHWSRPMECLTAISPETVYEQVVRLV